MEIVDIFAPDLYSFKFLNAELNEYSLAMQNWNNNLYLTNFFEQNKPYIIGNFYFPVENLQDFIVYIKKQAKLFDDTLVNATKNGKLLDNFQLLSKGNDIYEILPFMKSKQNVLRLYGIKLGESIIISGSAIKLSQEMELHDLTQRQKKKLYSCQDFLSDSSIYDEESFFHFLIERQ